MFARNCRRNNKIRAHAYETTLSIQLSRSLPAIFIWKLQSLLSSCSSTTGRRFLPSRKKPAQEERKKFAFAKKEKMLVLRKTFAKDFLGAIKFSSLLLSCVLISPTTFNINSFLRHSPEHRCTEGQKDEAPAKLPRKNVPRRRRCRGKVRALNF